MVSDGIQASKISWGEMVELALVLVMVSILVEGVFFGLMDKVIAKNTFAVEGYEPETLSSKNLLRVFVRYILMTVLIVVLMTSLDQSPKWKAWFDF